MAIRSVRHIALSTPDIESAVDRWVDVLGFRVLRRWSWSGSERIDTVVDMEGSSADAALLAGYGFEVELFEFTGVTSPDAPAGGRVLSAGATPAPHRPLSDVGYTHLCLEVDDIGADAERLAAAGFQFWHEPVTTSAGDRVVYCSDPDGNVFELQQSAIDASQ